MDTEQSLVSIGMPVYQATSKMGSDTVFREAIESLLTQDYANFELIIVDNASTDSTVAVIEEYSERDSRLRLIRNPQNMGIHYSFYKVYQEASGSYYMWAADDDCWESNFVSRCVEQLEANPQVDLCFPLFMEHNYINGTSYERSRLVDDSIEIGWRRAMHILDFRIRPQAMIMGLFRREPIADLLPLPITMNGDLLFLYEFAFEHRFIQLPEVLGHKNVLPKTVDTTYSAQNITLPTWRTVKRSLGMVRRMLQITWQANISVYAKLRCMGSIFWFFLSGMIYVLTLHRVRL